MLPEGVRVLTRIDDATRSRHGEADAQRLSLTDEPATLYTYRRFLVRLYGFEDPVEARLHGTPGLADVIDVRARLHTRLMKSDLATLGIIDLTQLPRCASVPAFADVYEALGWIYVVERGRMLHSILRRHLQDTLPAVSSTAATYLGAERSAGTRMRELGATFDSVVQSARDIDRVIVAAHGAFRAQAVWYGEARAAATACPSRVTIAGAIR